MMDLIDAVRARSLMPRHRRIIAAMLVDEVSNERG
jgi:hypothetical protein